MKFDTKKVERDGKVYMQLENPEMTFDVSG